MFDLPKGVVLGPVISGLREDPLPLTGGFWLDRRKGTIRRSFSGDSGGARTAL